MGIPVSKPRLGEVPDEIWSVILCYLNACGTGFTLLITIHNLKKIYPYCKVWDKYLEKNKSELTKACQLAHRKRPCYVCASLHTKSKRCQMCDDNDPEYEFIHWRNINVDKITVCKKCQIEYFYESKYFSLIDREVVRPLFK